MTRRDRLERIAAAERDRRAGRVDLAMAVLGEGGEWPARVILALAKLDPDEGAQTRVILERSLDEWAADSGLGSLSPGVESEPELALDVEEVSDWASAGAIETTLGRLDTPLEHDELERAFAQAEAQIAEMHDANRVAERVLMSDSLGLAELSGEHIPVIDGRIDHDAEPDRLSNADLTTNETDAAWASPSIWPEAIAGLAIDEGVDHDLADAAIPSRAVVLATLERWLGNVEKSRTGGAR